MAQEVVGSPGAESHLRHKARVDPTAAALVGQRHRDEGRVGPLDLAQAFGELTAGGQGEAGPGLAGENQFATLVVAAEAGSAAPARACPMPSSRR